MNIRLNAICFGGFMALASVLAQPVAADEWNKRTEFQFSGPVEIPGKILAAGKYVFQLMDSEFDRNIVQVFSEDSNGKDTLVATLNAIPDYTSDTPDKPIVHFEERHTGNPEAIHSWFYPGENTGWQFVYPKGETLQTDGNTMPAQAPVAAAAAPSLPPAPPVNEAAPTQVVMTTVEKELMVARADSPAPAPAPEVDSQTATDATVLPETGGFSSVELMTGLAMLGGGVAIIFASHRKSIA
jgi:hypothetical protein